MNKEDLPAQYQIVRVVIVSDKADLDNENDQIAKNLSERGLKILHKVRVQEGWVLLVEMAKEEALSRLESDGS